MIPSVLDERILDKQNNYLYSILKYKKIQPRLVGTSSLSSQLFPADIDMLCSVSNLKPKGFNELQRQFQIIFNKIENENNLFFVEFKLQNEKSDDKYKFFNINDVNGSFFKDHYNPNKINYCKIDLLQFMDGYFKEVSCIYFFNEIESLDKFYDNYRGDLLEAQKEYYDEGKYYKSLKRFLSFCRIQEPPNVNVIIGLTNFFNSAVGKVYQINNYIMACMTYIDKFGIDERVRQFIYNIGLDRLEPNKLKDISKDYEKLYNDEALNFYKKFKIPVGRKMPFMGKRMASDL